jgi:hypothetical protein
LALRFDDDDEDEEEEDDDGEASEVCERPEFGAVVVECEPLLDEESSWVASFSGPDEDDESWLLEPEDEWWLGAE